MGGSAVLGYFGQRCWWLADLAREQRIGPAASGAATNAEDNKYSTQNSC